LHICVGKRCLPFAQSFAAAGRDALAQAGDIYGNLLFAPPNLGGSGLREFAAAGGLMSDGNQRCLNESIYQ
jgi:hypothetical protein